MITTQPIRIFVEAGMPTAAAFGRLFAQGPQGPTRQMHRFRSRSGRVPPPPYVGPERRRTPRYYVQLPIESAHGTGTTIDVSEDGVRFESTHRFVYGQVLTLRVVFRHVAGDYTPIDMTGDVVRVEKSGETLVVAVRVAEIHVR
ncbi:MAG: PilZ domain-containing protein [Methanobacteriota archaeon]|nr:MAG: PilZ domain-containing protein [Euryarchaeota archaeon]